MKRKPSSTKPTKPASIKLVKDLAGFLEKRLSKNLLQLSSLALSLEKKLKRELMQKEK